MDASGHIAAPIAGYAPQRRMVSLRSMAFGGAVLGWLVAFAIVVSVLVASTRDAVRDEARSALRLARMSRRRPALVAEGSRAAEVASEAASAI